MKVALVHDYLNEFGGAERVLLALSEIYPDAPIYTAFYRDGSPAFKRFANAKSFSSNKRLKGKKIIPSWAQKVPFFASKLHSPLRFLAPFVWNSFDFSEYDVVISSSSWYVTKGFRKRNTNDVIRNTKGFVEICYCHTPPRYLYGYPTASNFQKYWPVKVYAVLVNHFMRVYDFDAAQRVDWFIANSREVQSRIKKFYRRDSVVIYPPVDVSKFQVTNSKSQKKGEYFLVVSRLVGAKNVDLAVEVCRNLKLNLKIVGTGRDEGKLEEMAGPTVEFLGDLGDEELVKLYKNCRALIFPASMEDFGIVPVEAMAAGKPVIALAEGGVKETVIDGKTGLLVEDLAPGSFVVALNRFMDMEKKGEWDSKFIQSHAQKFSKERFKREIEIFVKSKVR